MMKKHRVWLLLVPAVIILGFGFFMLTRQTQAANEDASLPTFMDAKGRLDIKVGDFKLDKQPSMGDPKAPVKVIEFVDFKCPACRQWELMYGEQFKKEFVDTGIVQLYTINFPFLGPDSIEAALAGELVNEQGSEKFWEFKKKLYELQGQEQSIWATEKFMLEFVKDNIIGIDYDRFEKDLKTHKRLLDVKEDFKISSANGIYGTPSFVVNGQKVDSDYEKLSSMIHQLAN